MGQCGMSIWRRLFVRITNSFKIKLIGSLSCIIIIAFIVAGYYTYESNQKLFREEMSKQVSITNQEALEKLELKVQEMKRISQTIVFNTEIETMIKRYNEYKHKEPFQMYVEKEKIDTLINQLKSDAPYITGLYMFDLSGQTVYYRYNTPSIESLNTNILRSIRLKIEHTSGELVWMNMALPSAIEPAGQRDTIVAARWMKNSTLEQYGVLVITIDESFLASSLRELTKDGMSQVYLFNRSNELLYSNNKLESTKELDLLRELGETEVISNHLYIRSESIHPLMDSFLLVSAKSLKEIQDRNQELGNKIVYAGLLIALVTSVLITLAMEHLLRPLRDLLKGLRQLRSGKFETRVAVRSKDELAYIGDSFNAMAEHVEQLINEVYLTKLSEQEAELKTLQAQLNPHFLYNFFNEVYWKLHAGGERDTAALIAAVAGMLRHSLMPVRIPTTVREEVKQMRNYVKIQAELFETDLAIDIQAEESVMEYEVMRSLLQPIVENVFLHAFRNKLSDKMLRIEIREDNGFLRIEVEDNGCGMDEALIRKLLHGTESLTEELSGERESLGVRSVLRRIELLHGPPYRMEIESALNQGTTTRLYLPVRIAG